MGEGIAVNKVIDEFSVEGYRVLILDEKKAENSFTKYSIDGKEYEAVNLYDTQNCIAVKSNESCFVGKTVRYI